MLFMCPAYQHELVLVYIIHKYCMYYTFYISTVFDLISEHTLISEHPPILCW